MLNVRRSILLEPAVLSEEYLPGNVPGRENQICNLRFCLSPVLRGEKPIHVWLHGKGELLFPK
jgi:Cdc6-like AAA superfamily ATPase